MDPFFTVYTPTYKRPNLLRQCVDSVRAQTAPVQHLIAHDHIGLGIQGMFRAIQRFTDRMVGEYVYVLQDDDLLADMHVLAQVQAFADANNHPPVIIVRNQKRGQIYPTEHAWQSAPVLGHIDLGSYIVRRDVFTQHVLDFGPRYSGDFDFIEAVWRAGWPFAWCDVLVARAQAWGQGKPEKELRL